MKLIDKKGKLFGIVNIIDLSVILLLGVVIVFGGQRFLKSAPQVNADTKKAVVEFEVSNIRTQSVDALDVGDILYNYDRGQVFGKVIQKKIENYTEPVQTIDGEIKLAEVPDKYVLILTVESDAVDTPSVTIIGGEHTRVGAQFRLKNKKTAFFGTVLGLELVE